MLKCSFKVSLGQGNAVATAPATTTVSTSTTTTGTAAGTTHTNAGIKIAGQQIIYVAATEIVMLVALL